MSQNQITPKGCSQSSEDQLLLSYDTGEGKHREYWMKTVEHHEKNTKSYSSNTYRKPQQPSDFSRFILNQNLGKYLSECALPI